MTTMPYAWLDPCSRTFEFNTTVEPWNDPEMRWAINYADRPRTDRQDRLRRHHRRPPIRPSRPIPPLNNYVDLMKGDPNFDKLWTHDAGQGCKKIIESKGWTMKGDYYEKDGKQLAMAISRPTRPSSRSSASRTSWSKMFQAGGINATHRDAGRRHLGRQPELRQVRGPHGLAELRFDQRAVGYARHAEQPLAETGGRTRQQRWLALGQQGVLRRQWQRSVSCRWAIPRSTN